MYTVYDSPMEAVKGYGFIKKIADAEPVAKRRLDRNTWAYLYDVGTKKSPEFTGILVGWEYPFIDDNVEGWVVTHDSYAFESIEEFMDAKPVQSFW